MSYKRFLLKVSGESLASRETGFGMNSRIVADLAEVLAGLANDSYEIGVVVGGGNYWRGRNEIIPDRVTADHIGMLATTMNALALGNAIKEAGADTRVMNPIHMSEICEPYIRNRALRHLEKGRLLVFAGGTGCPFFSTDTAAALRASELNCEIMLKATMVDGVYNKDPKKYADAVKFDEISLKKVIEEELAVMDAAAAAICRENKINIKVFDIGDPLNIRRIAEGEKLGTTVTF